MLIRLAPRANKIEYINLEKVAYINVTDCYVFNFCSSYTDSYTRIISTQRFIDLSDNDFLSSKYFKENFIDILGDDRVTFVNINHILMVKGEDNLDTGTNKIIIQFTNPVSRKEQGEILDIIPEFLYIRMKDADINAQVKDIVNRIERLKNANTRR